MQRLAVRRLAVVAVVVGFGAVGFGACGDGEDRPGQASACGGTASVSVSGSGAGGEADLPFEEQDADTEIPVVLKDYEFAGVPDEVAGPNVLFEASVQGSNCHELEVLDADGEALGEIPSFPSTEKKELGLELEPGTYTLQCLVKEGAKTHAELGMKQTLTVTAAP
jgi:hypothetical protein